MTTLFLIYELKVAVLVAVFYIFWRLLLAHETWHQLNRVVLLSTAVASFILPLCVITIHQTVEVMPAVTEVQPVSSPTRTQGQSLSEVSDTHIGAVPPSPCGLAGTPLETEQPFDRSLPLMVIYIVGVLVVLTRMLLSLWRLRRMTADSEIHPLANGRQIAVCDEAKAPFSWWKTVFLNRQDFEEGTTALLTHELGHIRQHHSADVLFVELLTALQWFNPAMWMLRADLRTIHEYEADQQVISHGFNDIQYLHLLIRKAATQSGYSLANGFINSALKKRINMITKQKSGRRQWLKVAYILPVVAVSLAMSAQTEEEYTEKEESAIILTQKDGEACMSVKVPAGAFYTWLVNGNLAERGMVREDKWLNVRGSFPLQENIITLDGQEVGKDFAPYVPLSSIKEVKLLQGEAPRRIELYTHYVTEFTREAHFDYPADYKEKEKAWMFFKAEDAATGRQLGGAEITIPETGQKAMTNDEGWCELKVPLGTTVKASCLGFESETYKIDHINGNEVQGWTFWMSRPGSRIYRNVQRKPQFPGDMKEWVARHTKSVKTTDGKAATGRVTVWLVINEDGSVSGVRLRQGVNKTLNDEALRVVRSMPRWQPAIENGRPVKYLTIVSVPFGR